MIRSIQYRRNNRVAATYVAHALKRRLLKTFHTLSSSPCLSCRKSSYKTFLQQRRRLQRMSHVSTVRSRRVPSTTAVTAGPQSAAAASASASAASALSKPQIVTEPLQSQAQPAKAPEQSKKRKLSEPEQPDAKSQQQSKKSRRQEAEVVKKEEPKPVKQVKQKSETKEASTTSATKETPAQHLPSKKDVASKKPAANISRVLKSWPKSVGKQKVKGLSNPGNWCYRRSVLQSLIAIPQFFNILDESHKSCPKKGKCVTCAMRQLLQSYHTAPGGVGRDLAGLDTAIRATGKTSEPRWRAAGQTQEDSHEFLQYLLGTVENAKGIQKDQFSSLFRIKHRISWTCGGCGKSHVRSDPPGLSLNLPIPKQSGQVNISACLDTYHKEPNVTIRCDKCKKNAKRTRTFQIEDAPDVLPIQLMRFGFSGYGPTKNKQHVEFPEDLDLSRWALDKSKPLQYRLQAVVAHSGTLKFGHYIAYVRGPDGIKDISDADVSNTSAKEWRKPSNGFHPYILMYIKQ